MSAAAEFLRRLYGWQAPEGCNFALWEKATKRSIYLSDAADAEPFRRTFASVLIGLGHDPAYVMAQMGHTNPAMTLGLYAKAIRPEDRQRLCALANGEGLPGLAAEHATA